MKNITLIRKINNLTMEYIQEVKSLGNECDYTDRIIEDIIEQAKELEKNYNKFFASANKTVLKNNK